VRRGKRQEAKGKTQETNSWVIDTASVPAFLQAVHRHLESVRIVSFEVHRPCAEARALYMRERSPQQFEPLRDTRTPATEVFFCSLTKPLVDGLFDLQRRHKPGVLYWHIKGFSQSRLVFGIHDADMAGGFCVCLSNHIENVKLEHLCRATNASPQAVATGYDWDQLHSVARGDERSRKQ
jgi:hypothetical protein